jgi:hypothetical protein
MKKDASFKVKGERIKVKGNFGLTITLQFNLAYYWIFRYSTLCGPAGGKSNSGDTISKPAF